MPRLPSTRLAEGIEARETLATKADLAELKADLIKWNMGALLALAALVSAIVRLVP